MNTSARRKPVEPPSPPDYLPDSGEAEELIQLVADTSSAPRKPKPMPMLKPVGIPLEVVGVLLLAVMGYGLFRFATAYGVGYERSRLAARAAEISRQFDVETIKQLTGSEADSQTPGFRSIVAQLVKVRTANADCRFVYLMGRKDGVVIFLADATDPASPDYSPPGQVFEEASPELIGSFSAGEPFVEGPTTDRWGTWVSGLAPIRDPSTGSVIGVVGMDVNADRWRIAQGIARIVAALGTLLLAGVMFLLVRRSRA